jgi:hypothetical protein
MLPVLLTIWQHTHAVAADPAFDSSLLVLIIAAEIHAVYHNRTQTNEARKQTALAEDTFRLYKDYFEVTEKRKAETREKAAATRAAKKAAVETEPIVEPVPETPLPKPTNGKAPPPMAMPESEEEEDVPL